MRTFDYTHLPQLLFRKEAGDANARLWEDKGKLDMLKQLQPERLESLREKVHAQNVEASMHIDGLYLPAGRIAELLSGAQPETDIESQAVGYSRALTLIEEHSDEIDVSTAGILSLHENLFANQTFGKRSRYRKKDYLYVQVDGHMQAMPVSPITAFETPLVLGGACDSLAEALAAERSLAPIFNAVFTVDFLCIRPFDEGNGRIARLFSELLLAKAGFDVFRYYSLDKLMEETAMAYYDALNGCVEKWDRGFNTYLPYVSYWLDMVHRAYVRLFDQLATQPDAGAGKSERVRAFIRNAGIPLAKKDLIAALPDVSEATIEAALGRLVKEGLVAKEGAGRSTAYRWL